MNIEHHYFYKFDILLLLVGFDNFLALYITNILNMNMKFLFYWNF